MDDINPSASVPCPHTGPIGEISTALTKLQLKPDPKLDLTPPKKSKCHPLWESSAKEITSNQKTIRKPNSPSKCVVQFSAPDKPLQWSSYDHSTGKKQQKTIENKGMHCKRRKPTVSASLVKKKSMESKSELRNKQKFSVKLSETEATKYHKPEINSCLKLAQDIKRLNLKKEGLSKEIAKQMRIEKAQQEISEKASVQVNIPFGKKQYKDLVPVDVAPEDVVGKLQEEREMKVKAVKPIPRPRDPEPDLMEFFSPSFYYEFCGLHSNLRNLNVDAPQRVPIDNAFQQYRRLVARGEPM